MKTTISIITLSITSLIFVFGAWAECPDGKSEIQLTTPSGTVKFMCIPDVAVDDLENATDNSAVTIIPSGCPCWDEADIGYYTKTGIVSYCTYDDGLLRCYDSTKEISIEANKAGYCRNLVTAQGYDKLTSDMWNVCYELVSPFLVN